MITEIKDPCEVIDLLIAKKICEKEAMELLSNCDIKEDTLNDAVQMYPNHIFDDDMTKTFPVSIIQKLVDMGAPVNFFDGIETPLGYACQVWHVGVVELLLKAGADPDFTDIDPQEPIECQESILQFEEGELWLWHERDRTKDMSDLAKIVSMLRQYSKQYKLRE